MKTIEELDALHAAATAGPGRMVFVVRAYEEWPAFSARLRAAEMEVERLRAALLEAANDMDSECDGWGATARAALGEP